MDVVGDFRPDYWSGDRYDPFAYHLFPHMAESPTSLRFSIGGNAKLNPWVASFSLPSGHSCPGAHKCLAKADRETGRLTDGPHTQTRCFAASMEAAFPTVRQRNWHNFDLLRAAKTYENMRELIMRSLPDKTKWTEMRIHVSGDFFNLNYLRAWVAVARHHHDRLFYAYTTSGHLFRPFLKLEPEGLPENFKLTGSMAGKYVEEYKVLTQSTARIVLHPDDTDLPIDHDDSHAKKGDHSFALLLHGAQPAGSAAAKAKQRLQAEGIKHTYSR